MRISFDLDDTLIVSGKGCLYEPPIKFPYSFFFQEPLRKGTVKLCSKLEELGWEICVYTTSERSVAYIKRLFRLYHIKLYKIINQNIHQTVVQGNRREIQPSKVPSKFGINLHIDDDISVKQNGLQYGFHVLIIDKRDQDWDQKVLDEANKIARLIAKSNNILK